GACSMPSFSGGRHAFRGARPLPNQRSARSPRIQLGFEQLENRLTPGNLNSPLFDNGIIGRDPATGDWSAIRFDGTANVTESLVTSNPNPNWQTPLVGDVNGDGRADILGWDPNSGNWSAIESDGTSYTSHVIANWSPTSAYRDVLLADVNGD